MECKDKQRIQNNVHHCSDQNREHTCFGKTLCGDKHIHAKGKLDENSADSVNVHIIYSVFNRIFTGTEGKKKSTVTKQQDDCQDYRNQNLQEKAVTQNMFCSIKIIFSHCNRSMRCTTASNQCGKSGNDHNQWHTYTDSGKGKCPITRNVSNVNTVNNVVQHIDELCGDRRKRQPEHQLSDGFSTQKIFVFVHV